MKKIILALMLMVSASFASDPVYWEPPTTPTGLSNNLVPNTCYYDSMNDKYIFITSKSVSNSYSENPPSTGLNYYNYKTLTFIEIVGTEFKGYLGGYAAVITSYSMNAYYPSQKYRKPACDGVNLPEKCDNVHGQFLSASTGQCVDCMPFPTFEGRATCACDADGSSYSPNAVSPIYSEVVGNYSYSKQGATCANGKAVTIYYDPVSTSPADNNNTTPTDNNTTSSSNNNSTTPTDGNSSSTTPSSTPSSADVVKALNQIQNGQKDAQTALTEIGLNAKAIKENMDKNTLTFSDILSSINSGNVKADKMFQLMDDEYKGQVQYRNAMGKWIDQDLKNATSQLDATVAVKDAVNGTTNAVKGTTGAVNNATNAINTQGKAITDKLGELQDSLRDKNGTDLTNVEDKLDTLHKDNNSTQGKLDKLHDDNNKTLSTLDKIKGMFDSNTSVDTNGSGSSFSMDDMFPNGDKGWFSNNALDLKFSNSSGGGNCQCATSEFKVAGKTFVFPPPELLDMIPFDKISMIIMACIYILGLRQFLRN